MKEATAAELKQAVEGLHNCEAMLCSCVSVRETFADQTVWEGVVHVFSLTGHPEASACYAWSGADENSKQRKFYTVLRLPPITSALDAVRAATASVGKA